MEVPLLAETRVSGGAGRREGRGEAGVCVSAGVEGERGRE